jgi:hypothetical protein
MSQTNSIIALVAGLAVLGGAYVLWTPATDVDTTGTPIVLETGAETPTDVSADPAPTGKKMAFADFIKQGGSHKCTVNQSVGGTETKGITYVSDGMIRGEYNTTAQGFSITTTLIVRDGYTHTWTSMTPGMGFKSKVVEGVTADGTTKTSGTYSFNAEQIGDYNCEPWVLDSAMFTLPDGVVFKEA